MAGKRKTDEAGAGAIRVGIGGWTFEPWRGTFFPADLRQADELNYASRALSAIEINGTFYSTPKPGSCAKWAAETPDGFVFSVKASRYIVNRKELATAGESMERFLASGLADMGPKLGPMLWQLPPFKKFDAADIGGFFKLLPKTLGKLKLRHAIEVRHDSFANAEFVALARKHNVAIVLVDSDKHPLIADVTADFTYARLERCSEAVATGYPPADLKKWAARADSWAKGDTPGDLKTLGPKPEPIPRDVFMFFISGDKVKAPAAAQALIKLTT
jgi:uncharacterized protein YecE (DUF72 family)